MKNREVRNKGAFHYYLQSTSGVVGAILVLFMTIVAICSLFGITPYDPVEQHIENILQGPSSHFWFGTDEFGRDVFSRTLEGMRRSLTVSITAVSLAATLGVCFGILAGYIGRWFDQLVTRVSDVFFAFPAILLAL
ncbi:MAG: ABC transporter permease, partial [Bacteroidota bacterium]|nr:ABC transporter permease [Bacteroidota bacterium]